MWARMEDIQANKKDYKQRIKASSGSDQEDSKSNLDEIKEVVGLMVI